MAFKEDIQLVLNRIGSNLVGNLKEEYGQAAMDSYTVGNFKPLVKFYNDNEKELTDKYGISINDIIGLNENTKNTLIEYGLTNPIITLSEPSPAEKAAGIMKDFVLPILGIIAGGAAVLIIIKTLKK